jgi:hypothetical protein
MVEQEATLPWDATATSGARLRATGTARGRGGLLGSFGPVEIAVPRARLFAPDSTSRRLCRTSWSASEPVPIRWE